MYSPLNVHSNKIGSLFYFSQQTKPHFAMNRYRQADK